MAQGPNTRPDQSRWLTDDVIRTIRRIADEPTAPLDVSISPSTFHGQRLQVKLGQWTVSVTPGMPEILSGHRRVDEAPVTPQWFSGQARALVDRAFPWAASLRFEPQHSARSMKALWQQWEGPVRMPTRLLVTYGDHGAYRDLTFFAQRVTNPPHPAWVIERVQAERLVLDRHPDYLLDGDPQLYMAGGRTAWSVAFQIKPGIWNRATRGAESVDAITGEVFGGRMGSGIRRHLHDDDPTLPRPRANPRRPPRRRPPRSV